MYKYSIKAFILLLVICSSWGFLVHRTLNQISIYSLPDSMQLFYFKNMKELVKTAVDPDLRQKIDSTEKTKHFIDLDGPLFKGRSLPDSWDLAVKKYTEKKLRQEGTLPWEIMKTKIKLTEAFKNRDRANILLYSSDLGHYISDAFVPLHTTKNYDGQLSNQIGLHGLWETECPQFFLETYILNQNIKTKYQKNVNKEIWRVVRESATLVSTVIEAEKEVSKLFEEKDKYKIQLRNGIEEKKYSSKFINLYNAKMANQINSRLLKSAEMVSDIWYTCWVDAKKPDINSLEIISELDKLHLKAEVMYWQNNTLIQNKLLRSKNGNN